MYVPALDHYFQAVNFERRLTQSGMRLPANDNNALLKNWNTLERETRIKESSENTLFEKATRCKRRGKKWCKKEEEEAEI